jgi:thymidine kinase
MKSSPSFTIFCGPMFSAKTSSLLLMLEKYKHQHKRVALFKPTIDDRYSTGEVVTHGGWKMQAHCVKTGADILESLSEIEHHPHVVAVDEAFMIPGAAETLIWLFKQGFSVVVSSLELSATGKPFQELEKMMVWATRIKKCTAVCTVCGQDAYYTHKKLLGGVGEIEVGGSELYEPRCAYHFPEAFEGIT